METFEEMEIQRYMDLRNEIGWLTQRKVIKRHEFYQQTFTSHVVYNGHEVVTQAIRVETGVINLDMLMRKLDIRIEIAKTKQCYWDKFIKSLSSEDQKYFFLKYVRGQQRTNERLDKLAAEEIQEIQEAISFRYGYRDEDTDRIELVPDDYLSNMDRILLEMAGV